MINVDMIPQYDTKLMTEVWSQASEFLNDYQNIGIPTTISNQNATTLYYSFSVPPLSAVELSTPEFCPASFLSYTTPSPSVSAPMMF